MFLRTGQLPFAPTLAVFELDEIRIDGLFNEHSHARATAKSAPPALLSRPSWHPFPRPHPIGAVPPPRPERPPSPPPSYASWNCPGIFAQPFTATSTFGADHNQPHVTSPLAHPDGWPSPSPASPSHTDASRATSNKIETAATFNRYHHLINFLRARGNIVAAVVRSHFEAPGNRGHEAFTRASCVNYDRYLQLAISRGVCRVGEKNGAPVLIGLR